MPKPSIARWAAERFLASNRLDRSRRRGAVLLGLLALITSPLRAQESEPAPFGRAVQSWIALPVTPGYEDVAAERILAATRGWQRDEMGNLVKRMGTGTPRRMLACGIDEVGYAVSQITDDGYLRVHANGNGSQHPLWDQFHEGQRVVVIGHGTPRVRNVPGVFAVRSNHLWRRREQDDALASVETLWLDVGAKSRAEVERLGIRVLDPVVREWPTWEMADVIVGPAASNRAGCAAIATAAAARAPTHGETIFVISAQSRFSWAGLTGVLARVGGVDSLIVIDDELSRGAAEPTAPRQAPSNGIAGGRAALTLAFTPRARYRGTLVESIRESDLADLFSRTARLAGVIGAPDPIRLGRAWVAPPPSVIRDSLSTYADLLAKLTDIYSVSGFEGPMRDAVREGLPAWARDRAEVDSAGNLIVAMGPDKDTTLFVAHMDEIGFLVTRVARDGTVSLRARGSFYPALWEGQPALLHRSDDKVPGRTAQGCGAMREGPLRGVFVPRDSAVLKQPGTLTAWFGLDSAALVSAGVVPGAPLTSYKCSARLTGSRFTARSVDDRAGTAALMLALAEVDTSRLDHKVIFAWSVREEGGLEGARAMAAHFGPTIRRVHAVDTFVSSDSPVESERFAGARIGAGAVARALDNSSVTPPGEVDRLLRIARLAGVPLQYGVTNGGNDGSQIMRYGAVNVSVAWPLRYSHSPAEVIDLRDLRSLARIVAALAQAPANFPTAR